MTFVSEVDWYVLIINPFQYPDQPIRFLSKILIKAEKIQYQSTSILRIATKIIKNEKTQYLYENLAIQILLEKLKTKSRG